MKKISIIIPVYNSASSLESLNGEIDAYFGNMAYSIEKIFVNDCSSDESYMILETIKNTNLKVIHLKHNVGQQNALFCGMHHATGDLILTMDDDLQHDISFIGDMLNQIEAGADLVYGVHPVIDGDMRSLGSKLTGYFFKRHFPALKGKRVSSFRLFKKDLLVKALKCSYSFIYLSAILLRQDPKVGNVEISKRNRKYGQSGYNMRKLLMLFLKLVWFYGPYTPEFLKARGEAYEEDDDVRCR